MTQRTTHTAGAILRPVEAAALLGVTVRTLDRYVLRGRLQPALITPGGHRRFRRSDVEQLLDAA